MSCRVVTWRDVSWRCFRSVACGAACWGRLRLKCDGTRAETRFRLSAKRTNLFKSAGASVQSTTGSRGVRISGSNAGYTMFRGSVKGTGYPLHSPVSPSLLVPCVIVCHRISIGLYSERWVLGPTHVSQITSFENCPQHLIRGKCTFVIQLLSVYCCSVNIKAGKVTPLQARCGPEGG